MYRSLFVLLVLSCYCHGDFVSECKETRANSPLLHLKHILLCSYDAEVRPTVHNGNATVVDFGLYIMKFDVDDITNMIDLHVWTKVTWTDNRLAWIPADFQDITALHVMSYEIWVPDIVAHSATDLDLEVEMPTTQCWLYHKGLVYCVPTRVFTTHCESDHTWWPYDMMNCTVHFASWSHSTEEIDFRFLPLETEGQLTVEVHEQNSEWEMVRTSTSDRLVRSKFDLEFESTMLTFNFLLKRHHTMHSAAYITLSIALVIMTLMTLWLEPTSTERMVIANLNFVIHLCCLQNLQWKVPFNGRHPPNLVLFYENSLVLATFSLILTSSLRYLQELQTEAPVWISSGTESILRSKVGHIFLVSILDPKVSASMEINADDNTNLVSLEQKLSTWRYTSILIGWLAFLIVVFAYLIMMTVLLPTNTSGNSAFNI